MRVKEEQWQVASGRTNIHCGFAFPVGNAAQPFPVPNTLVRHTVWCHRLPVELGDYSRVGVTPDGDINKVLNDTPV